MGPGDYIYIDKQIYHVYVMSVFEKQNRYVQIAFLTLYPECLQSFLRHLNPVNFTTADDL